MKTKCAICDEEIDVPRVCAECIELCNKCKGTGEAAEFDKGE